MLLKNIDSQFGLRNRTRLPTSHNIRGSSDDTSHSCPLRNRFSIDRYFSPPRFAYGPDEQGLWSSRSKGIQIRPQLVRHQRLRREASGRLRTKPHCFWHRGAGMGTVSHQYMDGRLRLWPSYFGLPNSCAHQLLCPAIAGLIEPRTRALPRHSPPRDLQNLMVAT